MKAPPRRPLLGRFGWKIIGALLLTAVIPLIAAVALIDLVVDAETNVGRGEAARWAAPLAKAEAAYRDLVSARKEVMRHSAAQIAELPALREAAASHSPVRARAALAAVVAAESELQDLALYDGPGQAPLASLDLSSRFAGKKSRYCTKGGGQCTLHTELPLAEPPGPGARVAMTFVTSPQPLEDLEALGQFEDDQKKMADIHGELPSHYRTVFLALLGGVVLAVAIIGFFIARPATRAVGRLSAATRKVAAGNLEAQVPVVGSDDLAQLTRAWNEMLDELRRSRTQITYLQKIGAWQDVARRLAHEIKNPLTPIQLAVQQLQSAYQGGDARYQKTLDAAAEIVGEEIATLRRLVDDFSAFAKLPRVEPAPLDLTALVDELLRANAEFGGRATLVPAPPTRVVGDKQLLRRALTNLIDNALEAAPGDAGRVVLTIASASDGRALLHVDDNGPGVDDKLRERIFDPYFTTKERGTGLGLAIVRKILLDHGGDVVLAAREAGRTGCRFTLSLPLASDVSSSSLPALEAASL